LVVSVAVSLPHAPFSNTLQGAGGQILYDGRKRSQATLVAEATLTDQAGGGGGGGRETV
jgi:hypothetical protein